MRDAIRRYAKGIRPVIILEIAAGTTLSILLADTLGLLYSASAGITTLLTIQNTRDKTLRMTLKRCAAFLLMLALCALILPLSGFSTPGFGLMLLLFVGLCYLGGLSDVMPSNAVLATHFLMEGHMGLPLILNELLLLSIGAGVGVLLNLLIPHQPAPLKRYRDDIEQSLKDILMAMARRTLKVCAAEEGDVSCTPQLQQEEDEKTRGMLLLLENKLKDYRLSAQTEYGMRLLGGSAYPLNYFQMRSRQLSYLKRIWANLERLEESYVMSRMLADFLGEIAAAFHEKNNALRLLEQHAALDREYDVAPLPRDRAEFENRALMYVVLADLKSFLEIKRDFITGIDTQELDRSW